MVSDPVADMLNQIRNAVKVESPFITLPYSNFLSCIADCLKREGYIWSWEKMQLDSHFSLKIDLKYAINGDSVVRHLRQVSKPGCRVYRKTDNLHPVLNGHGVLILSTNRGVLSDRESRPKRLGGEVICEVW